MLLYDSYYDENTNTLYGTHYSGFYSCINQVRSSLYTLISRGIYPENISFAKTLKEYRDKEDLFPILYRIVPEKGELLKGSDFDFSGFGSICSFNTSVDFKALVFENIKMIEDAYFQPSDTVKSRINFLKAKYGVDSEKTLAVLHRGTDKHLEAHLLPLDNRIAHIHAINTENHRILIQTDEANFRDGFLAEFGENAFVFEEMLFNNTYVYPLEDKVQWSINFESVIRFVAKCGKLITHAGNAGFVSALYRSNLKSLSQCY